MHIMIKMSTKFQAKHRVDVLNKEVLDLKTKIESNSKTQAYTEKQLTRMIVELNDVYSHVHIFAC